MEHKNSNEFERYESKRKKGFEVKLRCCETGCDKTWGTNSPARLNMDKIIKSHKKMNITKLILLFTPFFLVRCDSIRFQKGSFFSVVLFFLPKLERVELISLFRLLCVFLNMYMIVRRGYDDIRKEYRCIQCV